MAEFRFLDTNILLYLYDRGTRDGPRAAEISRERREAKSLVISTQVIQEFHSAGTRKLSSEASRAYDHILRATKIERRFAVSFWMS